MGQRVVLGRFGEILFVSLLLYIDGDFQTFVHRVADEHLVIRHPYTSQDAAAIDLVCKTVRQSPPLRLTILTWL